MYLSLLHEKKKAMPCDYSKYPKNWKSEIRPAILKRAGNKCEICGAENKSTVYRNGDKPTKIVLTIAHFYNPDPMDCRPKNLKALCQRCHLHHDKEQHQTNARLTRERKAGLQRLFAE